MSVSKWATAARKSQLPLLQRLAYSQQQLLRSPRLRPRTARTASRRRRSATLVLQATEECAMWKRKEDEVAAPVPAAIPSPKEVRPVETAIPMNAFSGEVAHIGKSVVVKGELSGSEDLYLDGEVEGSIELRSHSLTIGPNGRVRANVY